MGCGDSRVTHARAVDHSNGCAKCVVNILKTFQKCLPIYNAPRSIVVTALMLCM
jgi:hypothetical protein